MAITKMMLMLLVVVCFTMSITASDLIAKDSCSECKSNVYGVKIRERKFNEDVDEFERSLLQLCVTSVEELSQDECEQQALSYTYALKKQEPRAQIYSPRTVCQIISACKVSCCQSDEPEQVHISLTSDPSQIVVMWVTSNYLVDPTVIYYPSGFSYNQQLTANAVRSTYTDGGWEGNIYTATLTSLSPTTIYSYQVSGSVEGIQFYSQTFQFTSAPVSLSNELVYVRRDLSAIGDSELFNRPVREMQGLIGESKRVVGAPVIALFGDMDTSDKSNETTISLEGLAKNNSIHLIVHSGDISYADEDEAIYDDYFRMIQPFAAYVPYMTAPGNHENYYNFSSYYSRLTMPINSPSKQYYSFNFQNIHFVSWSVEEYDGLDLLPGEAQYEWLVNDLKIANQNRDAQPWIVLFGHRPLYCSTDSTSCSKEAPYFRELIENVLNQYHVDIVIQAHKHNYERTYPVFRNNVQSTSYVNPNAPAYFVIGTGGKNKDEDWEDPLPDWSAAQELKYGYMLMSAPDAYSIDMAFVSKSYNPYDNVTISRTSLWW